MPMESAALQRCLVYQLQLSVQHLREPDLTTALAGRGHLGCRRSQACSRGQASTQSRSRRRQGAGSTLSWQPGDHRLCAGPAPDCHPGAAGQCPQGPRPRQVPQVRPCRLSWAVHSMTEHRMTVRWILLNGALPGHAPAAGAAGCRAVTQTRLMPWCTCQPATWANMLPRWLSGQPGQEGCLAAAGW